MNCPEDSKDWHECALNCIELLESIVRTKDGLVLDKDGEIIKEYSHKLNYKGQPGLGNIFFKWLHDNRYGFPEQDRVHITPVGDTYEEFPEHPDLANFDISDRKFIAVANAHPNKKKPTIYEATDSKWWGWRKALEYVKIPVCFLGEEYVRRIFEQKFPKHADD